MKAMEIGNTICGFTITDSRRVEDFGGILYQMEHDKTGAGLVWLDNKEENKVFAIAFRTLPSDSTGVFHMLEHSVLNGSEKYPAKGLFVEFLKGSLKTYLNAATYPDKTLYPVASRNEADFMNLMGVYLDSVFSPMVKREKNIFLQEGWRYEMEGEELTINGVVYNEMKGAFSSPDTQLLNKLNGLLYPDNCYGYVSGGDPTCMTELTYEDLKAVHDKFYHPSNSYIYLDGAMDLHEVLAKIDSYLSRFDRRDPIAEIKKQQKTSKMSLVDYYPSMEEEDGAYYAIGRLLGGWEDRTRLAAFSLLTDYLAGSNEAPLTNAILESGLAMDAALYVDSGCAQPSLVLMVRPMVKDGKEELKAIVNRTLAAIRAEGLQNEKLGACLDQMEYLLKDIQEPAGLARCDIAMASWLYGGSPATEFFCSDMLQKLREGIETGYFEDLMEEITFDGEDTAEVLLLPSLTKEAEDLEAEKAMLAGKLADLTVEEVDRIRREKEALQDWQASPETKKNLDAIPRIGLSDIDQRPVLYPMEIDRVKGCRMLFHREKTRDISFYTLYFPIADCDFAEMQALSLLTNLLGCLPTKKHELEELEILKRRYIGELDFNVRAYTDRKDLTVTRPYFEVSFAVLQKNEEEAIALVTEILRETDFTSDYSRFLCDMTLQQCKEYMSQSLSAQGNQFAMLHAASHCSASGVINELVEGYSFGCYIGKMADEFAELGDTYLQKLAELCRCLFTEKAVTISATSEKESMGAGLLAELFGRDQENGDLESGDLKAESLTLIPDRSVLKEYILIPSMVNYASSVAPLQKGGSSYRGDMAALTTLLDYDCLWQEIRVRNGAYGCGSFMSSNGLMGASSYRDPNPCNSIALFENIRQLTAALSEEGSLPEHYIIGALSESEPLMHAKQRAARSDTDFFMGVTAEDRNTWKKELLEATLDGFSKIAEESLPQTMDFASCIVGCQETWDAMSEEERKVWKLFV